MTEHPARLYREMTWAEIAEAARADIPVAIPIGSTEQHGHHLPVCTDWLIPEKLLKLREECAKQENQDKAVCKQLLLIPGLPTQDTPSIPVTQLTSILTSLPSVSLPPLLPRAAPGRMAELDYGKRGPTMAQLMDLYDPDLVNLLVPGMVLSPGGVR